MAKKLIIIAGPAGVGKTAVSQALFSSMAGSAWLDGDWCWMVNPYKGKTQDQKRYAEKAFGYILDGYLNDANTQYVLFSWLIRHNFMFDLVTSQIKSKGYGLYKFVLTCDDRQVYQSRMRRGGRRSGQVNEPVDMDAYRALDAYAIDVSTKTVHQAAEEIRRRVEADGFKQPL